MGLLGPSILIKPVLIPVSHISVLLRSPMTLGTTDSQGLLQLKLAKELVYKVLKNVLITRRAERLEGSSHNGRYCSIQVSFDAEAYHTFSTFGINLRDGSYPLPNAFKSLGDETIPISWRSKHYPSSKYNRLRHRRIVTYMWCVSFWSVMLIHYS